MRYHDAMRQGLEDELQKIAGELQGFTRVGRKPIGVDRLLEREAESTVTPSDVAQAGPEKVSAAKDTALKTVGLMGAGALGYHAVRKADQDRRMGRAMRLQSQQPF